MKTYTKDELHEIVAQHAQWLRTRFSDKPAGTRADLTRADLTRADLTDADLTDADLTRADLTRADLTDADLTDADLTDADLTRADLTRAVLTRADLTRAVLPPTGIVPEKGIFTAWKKVANGVVLELEIPADALRVNAVGRRKCRASHVRVIAAYGSSAKAFGGLHRPDFLYRVGEVAVADKFDPDIRVECSNGIHFFITRVEAEMWFG